MNISAILLAMVVVGGTGLLIAILLGIASEKFKVPVDEKEVAIRAELPGNNCGGCGYVQLVEQQPLKRSVRSWVLKPENS